MRRLLRAFILAAAGISLQPGHAADLTPLEQRWLRNAWPLVAQAQAQGLPLDIVVQPQPAPGLSPLALAFVDGRCKLVLSMRGNAEAQAQVDRIERALGSDGELPEAALALIAAHEIFGHCTRHLAGQWRAMPPGSSDPAPEALDAAQQAAYTAMRATRREEGYADLAALAWARAERPALYTRLHAWLLAERAGEAPGTHHDTVAWIREPCACPVAEGWAAVLVAESRPLAVSAAQADPR
jgi:hypothetical protein